MKQVLSVADFAMILNLVNDELRKLESPYIGFYNSSIEEYKKQEEERLARVKQSIYYKSLVHLKNALENLNIEVEVPDVEVKE